MNIIRTLAASLIILAGTATAQELYLAKTEAFRKAAGRKEHMPFDTAVPDPTRTILIEKDSSEFTVGFPEDGSTVYIRYSVKKKQIFQDKAEGVEYRCYTGYDDGGYPLMLLISKDETKGMMYYYYTNAIESFSKSEKMSIKKRK